MNRPTTRADVYRQRAAEADQKAQEARAVEAKNAYEELARFWRMMAERAERSSY